MTNEGSLYKKLRYSRNISQKELCKSNLSRTTLSKFENNKINLSFTNFDYLLNSIDISLDEFKYIQNDYSYDDKKYIINYFDNIFSVQYDEASINKMIVFIENYLTNQYSKSIFFILNILKSFQYINQSENHKIDCKAHIYLADIWNELSKMDHWSLLDIKIINSSLYFFEYSTCIEIGQQLIKSLKKYEKYTDISFLEASIWSNLTLLAQINNDITHAQSFSTYAWNASLKSKRIDYISISLIRKGIAFNENKDIDSGFHLLSIIDNNNLVDSLKKEVDDFYSL